MNYSELGKADNEDCSHLELIRLQIGSLFSTSHELIQKILKNLGYYDLLAAIQVCQSWCSVGQTILKKERRIRFATIHPQNLPFTDTDLKVSSNNGTPPFEALENFLERAGDKASQCFGFTCGGWLYRKDIVNKYSPHGGNLSNVLCSVLPKQCDVVLMSASGVVGSVEKLCHQATSPSFSQELSNQIKNLVSPRNQPEASSGSEALRVGSRPQPLISFNEAGYSIELEEAAYRKGPPIDMEGMSLLLFPKQPGIKIKVFSLNEKEFLKTYRPNSTEPPQKRIEVTDAEFNAVCGLTPQDELKAFLVFTHTFRNLTRSFIDAAQSRQNDNLAIGGGLVELLQQRGESFKGTIGIAMSGSNLRTASIVVSSSVRDEKTLNVYLQKLKDLGLPEGHSMCFLFSCCGRGSHWYGRNTVVTADEFCNVETRAFRKLFPCTPIFGFFGDGEIGNNFFGRLDDEQPEGESGRKRRKRMKQHLFHEYSSVFVLISFL